MVAYNRRSYSGGAIPTTLSSACLAGDTTLSVVATTNWPNTATGPFVLVLDGGAAAEEACLCTAYTSTSATVQRGYDGTTAVAHAQNAPVQHCDSAIDLDEANQLVHALASGGSNGQIAVVNTGATPPIQLQTTGYGIAGATPAVSLTTVSSYITSNVSLVQNSSTLVTSVSLAAGTWLISGCVVYGNTSATVVSQGNVDLSNTSGSTSGEQAAGTSTANTTASGDNIRTIPLPQLVRVLGATTSQYLNVNSLNAAGTVYASGGIVNLSSGVTAVRIA